jgi:adenosylcobinamide-GDP ribazoletransferase
LTKISDHWGAFLAAVTFYTRIPIPNQWHHRVTKDTLGRSAPWLPWLGTLIGGCSALIYALAAEPLGGPLAAILSVSCGILMTGAFHEDGLADMADGFGGGWTKADILRIMKDSTHGSYGVLALILAILGKIFALTQMDPVKAPWVILASHCAARSMAITFLATHEYVREEGKAQNATSRLPWKATFWGLIPGILGLLLVGWKELLVTTGVLLGLRCYLSQLFTKKLGGYTGDCLGASEQLAEVAILITCTSFAS